MTRLSLFGRDKSGLSCLRALPFPDLILELSYAPSGIRTRATALKGP